MSLGLLAGYGSASDSDNEEEPQQGTSEAAGAGLQDRMRLLSEGVGHALSLPPPPPPPAEPVFEQLPNPMKGSNKQKAKQKTIPGMSKKEMELMMRNAKWMDITTEEVDEDAAAPEFEYSTPLPISKDAAAKAAAPDPGEESGAGSGQAEYDYMSYVAEYQNYLAQSAALLQGQERSKEL